MTILLALTVLGRLCWGQASPPAYQLLRAEEDWSVLRDPKLRTDPVLRLKYIPIGGDGFVSLGADVRERYEGYADESFGTGAPDGNGYLQHRLMGHADLHIGHWRVFGQFKTALQQFRPGTPRANDVDRLDVHQGFVERNDAWGRLRVSIRAGRQEIRFGSTRLTGIREGPNVRLPFDGVRMRLDWLRSWRVDLLAAHPVDTRRGVFDDRSIGGQTLWGAYGSRKLSGRLGSLDVYYLGHARRAARFTKATAEEVRHSLGARWWRPPAAGKADYDWEFVAQTGRFGSGRIAAWYAATETGRTVGRWRPAMKANVASGDPGPEHAGLKTFHALYPDTKDFREQIGPGPSNAVIVRPFVETAVPIGSLRAALTAGVDFFWRTSARDGIYTFGGNALVAGSQTQARYIGTKPSVVLQVPLHRFTNLTFIHSHLVPGRLLRELRPGKVPAYTAIILAYRY